MNQTFWISNMGQIIPCSPNGHYAYIEQNYERLFGKKPLNEAEIHDKPYLHGWVHIQNHFNTFNVRGNPQAIKQYGSKIRDVIFDRLMEERQFTVNIEYNNKAMINNFGTSYSFNMPDQFEDLRRAL